MQPFVDEINNAIDGGLHYLAVMLALALPGICTTLEKESGWSGASEYKDWYDRYLAMVYVSMDADECYSLRCGVVHMGQSNLATKTKRYSRIIFALPSENMNIVHRGILNDALILFGPFFCADMIAAVTKWSTDTADNNNVKLNKHKLLRYRPAGMAPYLVGLPVIA